ncbi:hypothetical protein M513_04514 [Trichuris suis]|uniref:SH2 domain-containing protein n=1 Tax=Trichuris suis TaxID=68888 RepID=A0A085MBH3_9BILA|nr:hypothetical protein M513_04514 [Trichuris suis]
MTEKKPGLGVINVVEKYSSETLVKQGILTNVEDKEVPVKKIDTLNENEAVSLDQVIKKGAAKRSASSHTGKENFIEKTTSAQEVEKHSKLVYRRNIEEYITLNETSNQSAFFSDAESTRTSPLFARQVFSSSVSPLMEMEPVYLNISVPLCKLPYYHYRKYPEELAEKLTCKGDYLVFLNLNDHSEPTLCARDETNNIQMVPIENDSKGYFILHLEDSREKFTTIGKLIHFYAAENLGVQKSTDSPCYLRRPVFDPEYQAPLLLEKSSKMDTWAYFHPIGFPLKSIASALTRNGDYVLFGKEGNPNSHRFVVRWEEYLYILQFRPNKQGRWTLPRVEEDEPTEMVESLDQLIKSCARARAIVHGICFVKPIKIGQLAARKIIEVLPNEIKKEMGQLEREGVAQPRMAPRPLHALPTYFGRLSFAQAVLNLQRSGEYLLYTNVHTKKLTLAVCWITENETTVYSVHITKSQEGFFQVKHTDAAQKFGTVDELINYYEASHQPIQVLDGGENLRHEICLLKPVQRRSLCREYSLFEDDDKRFLWCHERIGKKKALELLKNSGDYLFRRSKDERLIVTVRWNDKCYDLKLKPVRRHKREEYELPKYDDAEPTEYATDIFDFVKSAVTSQMQLNGMVLKNCILPLQV